jgi:hypothetical protein
MLGELIVSQTVKQISSSLAESGVCGASNISS